jgi:hypothetical protein
MKKILFDASIHFGQFSITNPDLRIRCKNSQASILPDSDEFKALYTFFENGWMDAVIWSLTRDVQDTYYPFMDVFFSNKNITGIADNLEEMSFATMIGSKFPDITSSAAITCALAVTRRADEVHTLYKSLLNPKLVEYMKQHYNVEIKIPVAGPEAKFVFQDGNDLEDLYEKALEKFKIHGTDLLSSLHDEIVEI